MPTSVAAQRNLFLSRGTTVLYALWITAVIVLLVDDRKAGLLSLGIGAVVGFLLVLGRWTLPGGSDDPPDDLRQSGTKPQLVLRAVVIAVALLWFFASAAAASGHIPTVWWFVERLFLAHTGLPRGALSPLLTLTVVVIPMVLLFALGATSRQLGLQWSSGGNVRLLLWLAIPAAVWIWRVSTGHLPFVSLLAILVENFMLNGLPEEFVFRGVLLSYSRRFLTTDWAILAQGALFALFHYSATIGEEHGHVLMIIANLVAENVPLALLFGLMALRSRSIAMSAIVHCAFDATRYALR